MVFRELLLKSLYTEGLLEYLCPGRSQLAFGNSLVNSCLSDAQSCGKMFLLTLSSHPFHISQFALVGRSKLSKMQMLKLAEQPFRRFVGVGRSKLS